jgi:Tol biopolymer transport system component
MKIKLQEQPFQVLAQLLERPGEVVTREDLRNRLWPADTFVDFDHSLNAAIRRLRDALGDSAENPTFVETVARRGYRFLAPVSELPSNGNRVVEAAVGTPGPAVAEPVLRRRWMIAVTAIVLVLAGVLVGFFLAQRAPAPTPPRVTQLTANPVDDPIRAAAISRDGRYLAFSDDTGLYLRQIDTGETHPVALPEGLRLTSISWFPDSAHMVAALSGANHEPSLWEISAIGGNARKLVDDGDAPAVAPNGKEIAYFAGKTLRQRVWVTSLAENQPRELAGEDGDLFGRIAWSPDGRRIAYTTAKFTYGYGAKGKIAVVDLRRPSHTASPTIVLSIFGLEAPLTWAPDGRLIYTQAETRPRQADTNLWWIRLTDQLKPEQAPVRLTNDQGAVLGVGTSGDSKRTIYIKGLPQPDVYIGNLDRSGAMTAPQRLTLDDHQDVPFDWTTDNRSVIFMSDRTGTFDIYRQDIDKTVPDLLVAGAQHAVEPRLTPDGKQILYLVNSHWEDSDSEVPLMRVPLAGGAPQQVAKAKWISNDQCARAPATECVYSVITHSTLTFFQFNPMNGQASQVFELKDDLAQMYNWSLSPDGTTLAIAKGKWGDAEARIQLVSLKGGADRWLTVRGWPGVSSLDWAADSKSIWASTGKQSGNALLNIDLKGSARTVWRPRNISVAWAIPSRDGKHLALHVDSSTANVWMLEH